MATIYLSTSRQDCCSGAPLAKYMPGSIHKRNRESLIMRIMKADDSRSKGQSIQPTTFVKVISIGTFSRFVLMISIRLSFLFVSISLTISITTPGFALFLITTRFFRDMIFQLFTKNAVLYNVTKL